MSEIIIEQVVENIELNIEETIVEVVLNIDEMQVPGKDGTDGIDGKSAYQAALYGGFVGTEAEFNTKLNISVAPYQGSIVPTSPAPTIVGAAYWTATQAGTYTNFGGVVVSANSLATISRNGAGAFTISQTPIDFDNTPKYTPWTAKSYASTNNIVTHLGKDWYNTVATVAGDVPGTSSKWVEKFYLYAETTLSNNYFIFSKSEYGKYITGAQGSRFIQSAGSTWYVSDFTPIESGEQINFYNNLVLKSCAYIVYDINKTKISDGSSSSFVAPTSAKFVKVDINVSNYNLFQITKGAVAPTKYTLPSYSFKNKDDRPLLIDVNNLSEKPISHTSLITDKIKESEVNFLIPSINLYDPLSSFIVKEAYLTTNGNYNQAGSPTQQVAKIKIKPNTVYTFYNNIELTKVTTPLNIINIDGSQTQISASTHTSIGYYESSSTAEYVRITTGKDQVYFTMVEGLVPPTAFTPYGYSFAPSVINDSKKGFPFSGRKIGFMGDSITMQFLYGRSFLEETRGIEGFREGKNGGNIGVFGQELTAEQLAPLDLLIILGGTNNYGVPGGGTIGTIDSPMDNSTVHGQIKGLINRILTLKPNLRIIFFTPTNRGLYAGTPAAGNGYTPNPQGLTIKLIAEAIIDECRYLGIASYDLLSNSGINYKNLSMHCADNLHPSGNGAKRLGTLMGKVANTYFPFDF